RGEIPLGHGFAALQASAVRQGIALTTVHLPDAVVLTKRADRLADSRSRTLALLEEWARIEDEQLLHAGWADELAGIHWLHGARDCADTRIRSAASGRTRRARSRETGPFHARGAPMTDLCTGQERGLAFLGHLGIGKGGKHPPEADSGRIHGSGNN